MNTLWSLMKNVKNTVKFCLDVDNIFANLNKTKTHWRNVGKHCKQININPISTCFPFACLNNEAPLKILDFVAYTLPLLTAGVFRRFYLVNLNSMLI